MGTVKILSAARLPQDSKIRVSCQTLDKERVKKDNKAQLKFAEGEVTQVADCFGSEFGGATEGNGATCPTQSTVPAVPASSGKRGQTECNNV